uniref:Uncharacterized protein n=1 Tax=Salix viminalis TaxID=40686 RepID=A0A6N2N9M7_SALVM
MNSLTKKASSGCTAIVPAAEMRMTIHEKEIEERWASNQRDLEQWEQKRRANILIRNGRRGIMQRGVSRREGEDEEETEE